MKVVTLIVITIFSTVARATNVPDGFRVELIFGDRTSRFETHQKEHQLSLGFSNNEGNAFSRSLSPADLKYLFSKLTHLASDRKQTLEDCTRSRVEINFVHDGKKQHIKTCLLQKGSAARKTRQFVDLLVTWSTLAAPSF